MKGMKKMKKENPVAAIFGFAGEEKKKLMLSAIISVLSVFFRPNTLCGGGKIVGYTNCRKFRE